MGRGEAIDLGTVDVETLPGLGRDMIHDLWRALHRKPPARGLSGELLVRALAWRLQCERHGGLTRGLEQRLARVAKEAMRNAANVAMSVGPAGVSNTAGDTLHETPNGSTASGPASASPEMSSASSVPFVASASSSPSSTSSSPVRRALRPGTRLVREWQGQVHEVTVLTDGFLWEGKTHRSLSVIAKAITGTSWNGWLFFGVNQKPGKPKAAAQASALSSGTAPTGVSPDLGSSDILSPPSRPVEPGLNKAGTRGGLNRSTGRGRPRRAERSGVLAEEIGHA